MSSHLIDRVKFDIQAENTFDAKEIQDKIFSICRHQLSPALDASLAEDAEHLAIRKEQLVLDLGHIPKYALDAHLIPRILEAFSDAMVELLPASSPDHHWQNDLNALILFLERGTRHWAKGEDYDPQADLVEMLKNKWPALLKFLKRTQLQRQVSIRMVSLASQQNYKELILKLRPSDSDFILSFTKAAVQITEHTQLVKVARSEWEISLKVLILHDLIRNHDSLFNRKMFIRRQLMGIAAEHRISYLQLLKLFDELLSTQEASYRYHDTLPVLLKDLTQEAHHSPDESADQRPVVTWEILFDKSTWHTAKNDRLQSAWKEWITQYTGEMKQSFESQVRTTDQVEFIVDVLQDERVDELITVLIPHLSRYVIRYKKAVVKGNRSTSRLTTAEDNLKRTLNFLIVSYLTIDMGTAFNKREFFTQQIVRLSRHYNLAYTEVLNFLIYTLESSKEPILFGMMELIRQIKEGLIPEPKQEEGAVFEEQDELVLLFYYLTHGQLHPDMSRSDGLRPFDLLVNVLLDSPDKDQVLNFIQAHKNEIALQIQVYDNQVFLQLIKLLLAEKVGLSNPEVKIISAQVKKHSRQSVKPGAFRVYVFEFLSGLKSKLQSNEVRKYDLDGLSDPYSLFCRYLIIKLSLEAYYSEASSTEEPGLSRKPKALTYGQARSQLLAALDHMTSSGEVRDYHKTQAQFSLRKILESQQESTSLIHTLSSSQLRILLRYSNKIVRFKILKLLTKSSVLIRVLMEELDVSTVSDDQAKGWEQVLVMDAESHSLDQKTPLIEALQLLDVDEDRRAAIFSRWEEILTSRKGQRSDELTSLVKYFESGKIPKGWAQSRLESLFLKHYEANYRQIHQALTPIIYQQAQVLFLQQSLSKNIINRWMQLIMGSQYQQFERETSEFEKILLLTDARNEWQFKNKNTFDQIRVLIVYEYQFRNIDLALIVRYYIDFFARQQSTTFTELSRFLYQEIKTVTDQMEHEPTRRKAEEVKKILSVDQHISEEAPQPADQTNPVDPNYKIENAGLILAWPFFKPLFGQLEYLDESGAFKNEYEQSKAVRLLQYVASGESTQPEYNMTLNKLLCGYPLVEPLKRNAEHTESERNLADSMLDGMIANWSKLGNTSAEGLRNTFLMRKGALTHTDGNWTLRVEKKGMDILLDFIPWTISGIKLPWFEGMLFVEWR
ncbi:MAG: contractile injection system tape measure protein [Reichenbachiella sp.]|uniref:contractile injection system tape measure protein n=1 Tax=Reichenbachiella sp. TaxID=2184521 RepID=UPI0032639D8C